MTPPLFVPVNSVPCQGLFVVPPLRSPVSPSFRRRYYTVLVLANNNVNSARYFNPENLIQLLDSKRFLRFFSRNNPIFPSDRQKQPSIALKSTQDFFRPIFQLNIKQIPSFLQGKVPVSARINLKSAIRSVRKKPRPAWMRSESGPTRFPAFRRKPDAAVPQPIREDRRNACATAEAAV